MIKADLKVYDEEISDFVPISESHTMVEFQQIPPIGSIIKTDVSGSSLIFVVRQIISDGMGGGGIELILETIGFESEQLKKYLKSSLGA